MDEKQDLQVYEKRITEERNKNWKEKALHGGYIKQTEDVMDENSWWWLKNGQLKKETEGLITAAQDRALQTNAIKHNIDKTGETPLCRLCKEKSETTRHVISACPKLSQKEYKKGYDKVHCVCTGNSAKKHGMAQTDKWYEHVPPAMVETETMTLKWDSTIYTNSKLKHNPPDISRISKETNECTLIDIAVPVDRTSWELTMKRLKGTKILLLK